MTDPQSNSEGFSLSQKRATLGLVALGAIALSGVFYFLSRISDSGWGIHAAPLMRIGLILGVFWLAIPNLDRIFARTPAWLWMATIVAVGMILFRPWSAILVLPALAALWGLSLSWWRKGR
jgi:hypothetical protein